MQRAYPTEVGNLPSVQLIPPSAELKQRELEIAYSVEELNALTS
ncbi:MAG: hypothetical protein ACYTE3_24655 [Planctomycetota bacterium]|jgi:hypothetical protein